MFSQFARKPKMTKLDKIANKRAYMVDPLKRLNESEKFRYNLKMNGLPNVEILYEKFSNIMEVYDNPGFTHAPTYVLRADVLNNDGIIHDHLLIEQDGVELEPIDLSYASQVTDLVKIFIQRIGGDYYEIRTGKRKDA